MIRIKDEEVAEYNLQYSDDQMFAILYRPLLWAHEDKKCARPEEIWSEVEAFVCGLGNMTHPEYQINILIGHLKSCNTADNDIFLILFCVCYKLIPPSEQGDEWALKIFQAIYPKIAVHNWFEHFRLMAVYYEKKTAEEGFKPFNMSKYDREHQIFDKEKIAELIGENSEPIDDIDVPVEKIMDLPLTVQGWIRNDTYLSNLFIIIVRDRIPKLLGNAKIKAKWAHVMKVMIDRSMIVNISFDSPKLFGELIQMIILDKSWDTVSKGVKGHKDKIAEGRYRLWGDDNINKSICKDIEQAFALLLSKAPN